MNEETVYHLAVEKPPDERAAFLDEACRTDAEPRGRVERLLAVHDRQESFILDTPPAGLGVTVDRPLSEQPGIGRGRGGRTWRFIQLHPRSQHQQV